MVEQILSVVVLKGQVVDKWKAQKLQRSRESAKKSKKKKAKTLERERQVDFADWYFSGGQSLL